VRGKGKEEEEWYRERKIRGREESYLGHQLMNEYSVLYIDSSVWFL
jgi:hypothetical protein